MWVFSAEVDSVVAKEDHNQRRHPHLHQSCLLVEDNSAEMRDLGSFGGCKGLWSHLKERVRERKREE